MDPLGRCGLPGSARGSSFEERNSAHGQAGVRAMDPLGRCGLPGSARGSSFEERNSAHGQAGVRAMDPLGRCGLPGSATGWSFEERNSAHGQAGVRAMDRLGPCGPPLVNIADGLREPYAKWGEFVRPEQIADIRQPSDPAMHPNGGRAAFVVKQMDLEDDWYVNVIWQWDGTTCSPFTAGPADTSPRWSPDGTRLAFLRAEDPAAKPQVAVMPADGGEPVVLTDFELGVKEIQWSPDGTHLAVVAAEYVPELQDLEDEERDRRARRITSLPFRWDNKGWIHDRRDHVWLVDPDGGREPVCITPGEHNEIGIVWSPDSSEVAFLSSRHDRYGLESGTEVYTVGLSGGEPTMRADVGGWAVLSFDSAGHLYAGGNPDHWDHPSTSRLYRLDSDGAVVLTAGLDRNVVVPAPPTAPAGPQWLEDGTARLLIEDRGTVTCNVVSAAGEVSELIGGQQVITGASFTADGCRCGICGQRQHQPW